MSVKSRKHYCVLTAGSALLACAVSGAFAQSTTVSVVVNSSPVTFQQPPVEQAGRVFVPLRGVFEKLGASVVYDDGQINATGNGHEISLHVGDTSATVDGRTETIDTAPFVVAGSTMVPLRFVSQTLGAHVRYDDMANTVYIDSRSLHRRYDDDRDQPAPPMPTEDFRLTDRMPHGHVEAAHPSVSATFSRPVDPDSVRIQLDGRDVGQDAYVSPDRIEFAPADLPPGPHDVRVTGKTVDGTPFDRSWDFTSGDDQTANFINNVEPGRDEHAGSDFDLRGTTLPNSTVRVAVSADATALGGIFKVKTGSFDKTVLADENGHFFVHVHVNAVSGGSAGVFINAIAPDGSTAVRRYSVRT